MLSRSGFNTIVLSGSVGVAAIATLAFYGHGPEMNLSTDRMIAADNLLMVFASTTIMLVVLSALRAKTKFIWKDFTDIDLAMLGIAVEAAGWVTHRSYWFFWRMARDRGWWEIAERMEDGFLLIFTALGFVLMMVGALLVLNPISRRYLGRHWFFMSCLILVGVWMAAYSALEMIPKSGF